MAEVTTVARPYAEAVFDLARGQGSLSAWSAALARLSEASNHPEVRRCVNNPKLTSAQLVDLFLSFGDEANAVEARNFLQLLADNDRLELLPQIRELYEDMKNHHEGVLEARVASAFPLDAPQIAKLVGQLEAKYQRKIEPEVAVDKELIGGVRIVIGDEVIDASVRGKLESMRAALTG
jgi:F-type H+-transporting ATPase subunit delta